MIHDWGFVQGQVSLLTQTWEELASSDEGLGTFACVLLLLRFLRCTQVWLLCATRWQKEESQGQGGGSIEVDNFSIENVCLDSKGICARLR